MTAGGMLRVVVGEDDPIFRAGICRVLEDAGIDVVGQAGDAEELARLADAAAPDVMVTDIQMPPRHEDDGLRAALAARVRHPGMGVLVLSNFLEQHYALDLVGDDATAVGYLLKERVGDERAFVESVRRVAAGGTALDPEVVARLVGRPRVPGPLETLTAREREVLGLMAEGYSNQGIAERLVVTPAAVEKHVTHLMAKLGLRDTREGHRRVLAVLTYLRGSTPRGGARA